MYHDHSPVASPLVGSIRRIWHPDARYGAVHHNCHHAGRFVGAVEGWKLNWVHCARSAERITGIHRDTIMGLLIKAGERSAAQLESPERACDRCAMRRNLDLRSIWMSTIRIN